MRKLTLLASVAVLPLYLAGCNPGGTPPVTSTQQTAITQAAATVSAAVLSPEVLAQVEKVCAAAQAPLATATSSTAPTNVSAVAIYPAAYCQQLAAAPQGQVPATTNSNTLSWLQTAVQLAGIVLPLVM